MSVNKNLSKLALNVNANGDVTEAGLSATYTSNAYAGGTFATNTFVRDTFTSNNYVDAQLATKDTAIGLRATNTYVKDTFTSNNYSQNFFANASNITSGTLPSGRLSGTYSINISGSADTVDGLEASDLTSNNFIQDNYLANGNLIEVDTSTGQAKLKYNTTNVLVTDNDSVTGNFVNIIGDLEVNDYIQAGANTGGPALTWNDGGGNSNLTFNHRSQKPDQDGNYGRIAVNTDSSTDSQMSVKLGSGGTADVTGAVTTAAIFSDTDQELYYAGSKKLATTSTGVDITGAITVGGNALVSNNFLQDQSTPGTPSYSAYTGQTIAVAIGSANNTAYPARRFNTTSSTYHNFSGDDTGDAGERISDAEFSDVRGDIFAEIAGNDDFENAGVTFSSSNNSFTVADGYSVSITIAWQVHVDQHDGWRIGFSGAWSGTQDVTFNRYAQDLAGFFNRLPVTYTAKGPGLFKFDSFTNLDGGTTSDHDLYVNYVDVNAVYYNVSIS